MLSLAFVAVARKLSRLAYPPKKLNVGGILTFSNLTGTDARVAGMAHRAIDLKSRSRKEALCSENSFKRCGVMVWGQVFTFDIRTLKIRIRKQFYDSSKR